MASLVSTAAAAGNHHHHPHNAKNKLPETVTGEEGTAKRNIIRRGGSGKTRKEGASGIPVDDGSLYEDPYALDEEDPNFDSEEEDGKTKIPRTIIRQRDQIGLSKMTLTSYKKAVLPIIEDFFSNGDFGDLACSLEEIGAPEYSYEFVKRLINSAIDKTDTERELASRLLSEFYPNILSMNMIGKGLERLFEIIDEIELDVPQAADFLAAFVARAVVDEVLPPSFLTDAVVCNLGGDIIDHAKLLLSRDHGYAKLERIWGPGDGRPVEDMKIALDQALMEYLLSSDLDEIERCLKELHSPYFYHEVVKRAVMLAVDKGDAEQRAISSLLQHLAKTQMLSAKQAEQGFNRLHTALPDMVLDSPAAAKVLQDFTARAVADEVLPQAYAFKGK